MDLTALVDVAIGLTLVYLGASLFVTIANEYIGQLLRLRAHQLKKDLKNLLNGDAGTPDEVMNRIKANPAFAVFFESGRPKRSYVDPNLLARQIVGGLQQGATGLTTMRDMWSAIESMKDCRLKTQLKVLSQTVGHNVDKFVENVSRWADQSLTMMGEAYKKWMQLIGLAVGILLAAALNIDTIALTSHLYQDKEARTSVSTLASSFVGGTSQAVWDRCMALPPAERDADAGCAAITGLLEGIQQRNETLGVLPLGWSGGFSWVRFQEAAWSSALIGWLLTGFATSLGATFWFDLLSKLVSVRHGMKKPLVEPEPGLLKKQL